MSDALSFADIDGQHVELLPARTVLTTYGYGHDGGHPGDDSKGDDGGDGGDGGDYNTGGDGGKGGDGGDADADAEAKDNKVESGWGDAKLDNVAVAVGGEGGDANGGDVDADGGDGGDGGDAAKDHGKK